MIWIIGLGGSLGAAARYLIGKWSLQTQCRTRFPIGTWMINITGSFLLGLITQLYVATVISESFWLFAGVGFCGAYTTFSTFGYETIMLIQENKWRTAVLYVAASLTIGVLAAVIGFYI